MLRIAISAAAVVAAILSLAPAVDAQQRERPTPRIPVTVVMLERLPQADAPFVVERRSAPSPRDVILLRTDATAEQLGEAVRTVIAVRQTRGDSPSHHTILRMRPRQAHPGPRRAFPWVQRVLADVRRAPRRQTEGYGRVRSVGIWLPSQQPNGRHR